MYQIFARLIFLTFQPIPRQIPVAYKKPEKTAAYFCFRRGSRSGSVAPRRSSVSSARKSSDSSAPQRQSIFSYVECRGMAGLRATHIAPDTFEGGRREIPGASLGHSLGEQLEIARRAYRETHAPGHSLTQHIEIEICFGNHKREQS